MEYYYGYERIWIYIAVFCIALLVKIVALVCYFCPGCHWYEQRKRRRERLHCNGRAPLNPNSTTVILQTDEHSTRAGYPRQEVIYPPQYVEQGLPPFPATSPHFGERLHCNGRAPLNPNSTTVILQTDEHSTRAGYPRQEVIYPPQYVEQGLPPFPATSPHFGPVGEVYDQPPPYDLEANLSKAPGPHLQDGYANQA